MDDNELNGALNQGLGAAEEGAGRLIGDAELEGRGAARQVAGEVQADVGKAQAAIGEFADKLANKVTSVGDRASDGIAKLGETASGAYDRTASGAQKAGAAIEPFVQQRPYAALGIAGAVGIVFGLLMASRNPKVVYVRPPH